MIGFVNTRTGARTSNLSGYPTETEAESVARLKAAGWDMEPGSYTFDEKTNRFEYSAGEEVKDKAGDDDGDKEAKPE